MVVMRQNWTSEEAAALKAGIDKYGEGKWAKILKDPKLSPILHLRSNVDLKDKWRNFSPKANGLGSRHEVRGARRNTTKKMKRRGMSLSPVVLSDPEIVVTKPPTVLSETSEVSELDSIKESISRLGNAMVDAITYAKEPCGSSQTAVSTYLEKKEEVAGEYSNPPQELFEKGKRIEVFTREEGFSDSWYVATVIGSSPPLSHLNKYFVEYETLMADYDLSCPLKELVDAKLIRPICPLTSVGSFRVGDIVDALYYDGWWIGIVTKALSDSRFKVKFAAPHAEHEFHASELRLHLHWVNGQWINPRTQTKETEMSELDSDTPKIVEKRGRPPKIDKSLTTGYESIAGVRTAEGLEEKHCEAKKIAPISVGSRDETRSCRDIIPCQPYPGFDGNVSYPGVKIAEGTEEKEGEMEDIAQILNLLTCNGTKSTQDNTPCQSPPDESEPFIKGERNVSPGLTIEIKEKEISGLDGDIQKMMKRRGRPPKLHKSSTTGNESTAGVRTADAIKEKHCESKGFTPISVGLARYEMRSRRGNVSYPGVRIAEGSESEIENKAPMLSVLTSTGAKSSQDDTPCQFPPVESQTFISDQKDEGNVSPRLTIKESTSNCLSKQMGMSTELLKLSRMESCEKAECVLSSDNLGRHYLHRGGKTSPNPFAESPHFIVDGVRTVKGREEKDCEREEVAPMLVLTCDGTSSPQQKTPCQSPQTFISDQNGKGNVPARLIIKESAEINLTSQMETSPESLEPRSMVEIPTESIEKAKCVVSSDELGKHYVRKKGKASANPSSESPHSFVDANITPGISPDVNQILPFKKTIPLWDSIESMEVFLLFPQKPHFRLLGYSHEDCREGLALGQMVTFSKIVKKIAEMRGDTPRSSIEKCLENLIVLEGNGFDVRTIRDRLKDVEQESRIMEFKEKKRKINEDVDEIEKKLKELQAKRDAAMLKMEMRDAAIEASRLLLNNIKDRMKSIQFDFEEVAVAPW